MQNEPNKPLEERVARLEKHMLSIGENLKVAVEHGKKTADMREAMDRFFKKAEALSLPMSTSVSLMVWISDATKPPARPL